jgi:hypothetical protein
MTSSEYSEVDDSIVDALVNNDLYASSIGIIETTFASSAQTFTSLNQGIKNLMNYNNESSYSFEGETHLKYIESAVMASVGTIGTTDALFGDTFDFLSDVVALIPSMTAILLTAATAVVEVGADILEVTAGALGGVGDSLLGIGSNIISGLKGDGWGDSGIFGDIQDDFAEGYEAGSSLASSILTPITGLLNSAITMGQVAITNYSN